MFQNKKTFVLLYRQNNTVGKPMRLGGELEVGLLPDHMPVDCVQSQVVASKALQTLCRPAKTRPGVGVARQPELSESVWPSDRRTRGSGTVPPERLTQ